MDLTERQLPVMEASSDGKLAIGLHFKLLAALHDIGKLDDEDLAKVASALIAEMPGVQERFEAWTVLESLVPDFERPEGVNG
jgi:hypothetical protein